MAETLRYAEASRYAASRSTSRNTVILMSDTSLDLKLTVGMKLRSDPGGSLTTVFWPLMSNKSVALAPLLVSTNAPAAARD